MNRRELLAAGAALGWGPAARAATPDRACIFILCTGGPSQLDTWDPKPDAPAGVRGPYGAIRTTVPGLRFAETLPRLARLAHRFAVIRTLAHDGDDLHETGLQRVLTGSAATPAGTVAPCLGAAAAAALGGRGGLPGHVVLPQPLADAGLTLPQGLGPGFLGPAAEPLVLVGDPAGTDVPLVGLPAAECESPWAANAAGCGGETPAPALVESPGLRGACRLEREPGRLRERYGRGVFGQSLLLARRLVEAGVRVVTVSQFPTLFGGPSWDCHGYPDLPTRVRDLRDQVATPFDTALAALLTDLADRGLWESTLVCAVGEFGRAPEITAAGGREHWTRCWSAMVGGGGIPGGVVVGESDARAAEPRDRPVAPGDLLATLHRRLGLPATLVGPEGRRPLLSPRARPLAELG